MRSAIGVDDVDPDTTPTDSRHHGPQRGGRTAAATDDLAEIIGVNPDLQRAATTPGGQIDPDILVVFDNAPDQMFQGVGEHTHLASAAAAGAGASVAAGASAATSAASGALAARFFGVVAAGASSVPMAAMAAS